ncbi:lupus La protein [Plectosphaerella cucumerina]|uniref:Lupus La protein n=1 Tax=Plectosphaerella cucumerina TaxID=40658 RepID=A0A8K0X159_9PEZI|nr:lupus La protein [Plectosphaerella cucumerina]
MSSTEEPVVKAEEAQAPEVKTETVETTAAAPAEVKAEETTAPAEVKTEETTAAPAEVKPEETTTEAKQEEAADKDAAKPGVLKTTARIDNKDYRNNKKFDPRQLPESEDPLEMRAQVEFYFNNANLPTDEHLWNLTGGPENKPVELKHIHNFGRMRRFPNYKALVESLKDSDVVEVSGEEGSEVVKRKVPYKLRGDKAEVMRASVYVKGFGDEDAMTQFNLEKFFKQFGGVNAVRLRRTEENLFKGSVFVEFASEEDAKAFLALEPAPKWEGHDLKIMSKKDYVDDKSRAIREGEIKPSNSRDKKFFEGRGGKAGKSDKNARGGRGNFRGDKNDWKSRRDHDQKGGFRDNGRGRGRGGRGGRGRGSGRGGNRDRDDRRTRDDKPADNRSGIQPTIKTTDSNGKPVDAANANGKRPREESGNAGEPQAKKVDAKTE